MKIKLSGEGILPSRAHPHDAGLDLYAADSFVVPAFGVAMHCIGVHVAIPVGYVGDIKSRSSLMKMGIFTDGTIDCGYTGPLSVVLINHTMKEFQVERGQKIAQLVIKKIITPELELVTELESTDRGTGGFGSTGR